MRRWGPVALLALLPLVVLWRCVLFGEVLGPWDHVRSFAPWNGSPPDRPFDVLQMDAALQFYVWRDLVFDSWGKGQIPLYNPYSLGGTALAGNSQSGAFYPLHILVGILRIPTGSAITLLAWFHLFWAGLGVYLLCRRMDGLSVPSLVAGATFALSPFMLSWIGIASVPTTVAWMPWTLLGIISIFKSDREGSPWFPMAGTAAAVGMMILAGHLQFVAYGLMGASVVWLIYTISHRIWKPAVCGAIAIVSGILVALPHWKFVFEWSQFSHRRGIPTEEGYQAYSASALKWWEFASIGTPDLLGSPAKIAGEPFQPLSTFWGALVKAGGNYAESAISVGAIVFCLALVSLRNRSNHVVSFGGLALLAILLSTASPLTRALYFGFPGWSATGSPGRAGVLLVLALCVLAGLFKPVVQEANTKPLKDPQNQMILLGLALIGIFSISVRLLAPGFLSWNSGVDQGFLGSYIQKSISPAQGLTFAIIAIAGLAYGLGRARTTWSRWLAGASAISLLPTLLTITPPSGLPPTLTADVGSERIAVLNRNWELLVLPKSTLPPNLVVLGRVAEIGGYDSLVHRSAVERLRAINDGDPAPPANGNMMLVKTDKAREILAASGVTRIWSSAPIDGSIPKQLGATEIFETLIEGPGLASINEVPAQRVNITGAGASLTAKGPGALTIRLQPLPSTHIFLNDQPISYTMKDGWPLIELPSGDHQVHMRAEMNPILWSGLLLPLTLFVFGILQARQARPQNAVEPE